MSTAERRFLSDARTYIECKVKKQMPRLDIPLIPDTIGPWHGGEVIQVPIYIVDILINEDVVDPIIPYILRYNEITELFKQELAQSDDIMKPIFQQFIEVAQFFLESDLWTPWITAANGNPANRNNSDQSSSQTASETGSQLFTSSSSQTSAHEGENDPKRALKRAMRYKIKIRDTFDDWMKLRRSKILSLMQPGKLLDPILLHEDNGSYDVFSRLYPSELSWVAPLIQEHSTTLLLGAFSQRSMFSEFVLGTLGLDWERCSEQMTKLQDDFETQLDENAPVIESKLSANGLAVLRSVVDDIHEEARQAE